MNLSVTLTALCLMWFSLQIFACEETDTPNTSCPPEVKAQYIAEMNKPMLTEEEIAKYAALLPLLHTTEPNIPEDVIKQFQELQRKLDGTLTAISNKYPSCTP